MQYVEWDVQETKSVQYYCGFTNNPKVQKGMSSDNDVSMPGIICSKGESLPHGRLHANLIKRKQ